jgi:hypothetical protein
MPPETRFVPRFAAEPPQEPLPYGRWAENLRELFLAACLRTATDPGEDPGEPGEIAWYPDRTWNGRTYIPATTRTAQGWEYLGYVSFTPATDTRSPEGFEAVADLTEETAEQNPDWAIDLNDEAIGAWRGEDGKIATMTLVWGRPLRGDVAVVTGELAGLAVDQCGLVEDRFTLLAPDRYRGDELDVRTWTRGGDLVAEESLYVDEDEEEDEVGG